MAAKRFAWEVAALRTFQGAESPNNSMQRPALRAAADAERWTDMEWTPIDREELQRWIERGLEAGGDDVCALFARIAREPAKWQLHPWGDLGGGFWVVAVLGNRVVWFNDIEDGFNISTFTEEGVIPSDEYRCNQDELHWALNTLVRGGGHRLGSPRPFGV